MLLVLLSIPLAAARAEDAELQQVIFESYLKLAEEGDATAQYVVANRYETGLGTNAKNVESAFYWYEQAAKNGHPLAIQKIEERRQQKLARIEAAAPMPVPTSESVKKPALEIVKKPAAVTKKPPVHATAAPAAAKKTPAPPATRKIPEPTLPPIVAAPAVEAAPPPPAAITVAKAPPVEPPPAPAIDVMKALLAGKWKHGRYSVDFLPSAHTACLQSGGGEAVCFSQELTRNVGGRGLTYIAKSTLSKFDLREGRFELRYVYNVAHDSWRPFEQPTGMESGAADLQSRTGWQEPGYTLECRMRDEYAIACTRADRKASYQFTRE